MVQQLTLPPLENGDHLDREEFERRYQSLTAAGILCSQQFPGLWLDPMALIQGDLARVLAVLQQGLAGSAHQAFVER
jgi:hypothetical protein